MGGLEGDMVVRGAGFRRNAITVFEEGASIPWVRVRLWRGGIGYKGTIGEMGDKRAAKTYAYSFKNGECIMETHDVSFYHSF